MKHAGDFLSRFKDLTPPDDAVRTAVATAVSDAVGARLSKKDVKIAHGVAFVFGSSIMKSAVALRRATILAALYDTLPKARATVRDVR